MREEFNNSAVGSVVLIPDRAFSYGQNGPDGPRGGPSGCRARAIGMGASLRCDWSLANGEAQAESVDGTFTGGRAPRNMTSSSNSTPNFARTRAFMTSASVSTSL